MNRIRQFARKLTLLKAVGLFLLLLAALPFLPEGWPRLVYFFLVVALAAWLWYLAQPDNTPTA